MRRAAPQARLRVDGSNAPASSQVAQTAAGLGLKAAEETATVASPWSTVHPILAAALPCVGLEAAQSGGLLVGWAPGLVRTVRTNDLAQIHDRRPPGIDQAIGAADANAALIHADGGWRAVVIPSLGDRLTDLGEGPVAIAPDGLSVAVSDGDEIVVVAMADGSILSRDAGTAEAIAIGMDGRLWAARAGAVGGPDVEAGEGPTIVQLRAASDADIAVALGADGSVFVADDADTNQWNPPFAATAVGISADGAWVLVSGSDQVAITTTGGELAFHVHGARCGAILEDNRVAIAGDWGMVVVEPVVDDEGDA